MFQPTNESFVQSVVEETRTRYQENTDDDHIPLSYESYQPSRFYRMLCLVIHFFGHLLHGLGERLENLGVPDVSLGSQSGNFGARTVTHHAH